ncbi:MAG: hypothetical protein RTU63_07210 [Candidatus Thorarchaeota archaeon]
MDESIAPELDVAVVDEDVDIGFRIACRLGGIIAKSEEEPDEDRELYGINPRIIVILLVLATFLFPVGGIGFVYNSTGMQPLLYGVCWISDVYGFLFAFIWYIMHPGELIAVVWMTAPACTFNFLFVYQINRFFYGKTSRDIVVFYGLLSMIAPSGVSAILWISMILPFIITPLPFQFFAGVLLLYKFKDPDFISPWDGYFLDLSWWTRQKFSIREPNQKVINLTKLLMDHDADWLDGWNDVD